MFLLEASYCIHLTFRQNPRQHFVDADLAGDVSSSSFIVAGNHHGLDAKLLQCGDRLAGIFFHGVRNCYQSCTHIIDGHQHCSFPIALQA